MKHSSKFMVALISVTFLSGPGSAEMAPQPQVAFSKGLENTFAADWQGVAGRIYFMQWSLDLQTWLYAPFIDFGDGMHSRGLAGTAPKAFFRLRCLDDPAITSLEEAMNADFDGDGLSNIFEVTFGYDPFDANSTADGPDNSLDPDGDGMTNATENTKNLNPMVKDNPKVQLQVTVE
jgi:hypothetical protein